MKRRKSKEKSPLIRLVGLEAAAVAAGMAGSPAMANPGDLDPSFGDVGRQSTIEGEIYGSLWSVDVRDDDSVLFGGGGEYYGSYSNYEDYFVGHLLPDGTPDAGFAEATLGQAAVYDTTLQADGKIVGVGVARQPDGRNKLLLFRLRPDGALDADFGLGGLVVISDGSASREAGYSVVVDPDGRIVVAGQRNYSLLVAKLLANGTLDAGFGSGGIYLGPEVTGTGTRISRTPAGDYRVIAQVASGGMGWDCSVLGVTAAGVPDAAFGSAGAVTRLSPSGEMLECTALAVQPDGRILIGGVDEFTDGYVGRLLANGAVDPSFDASVVTARFKSISALAIGATGSVFVAGIDRTGFSGASIVRLVADGTLDTRFGRDGATSVDPQTRRATVFRINEMKVAADDRLVVGGNINDPWFSGGAFVARLLGNASGGSPGVISLQRQKLPATEQGGKAVLTARRTGGSAGAIAVTYSTRDFPPSPEDGSQYAPGARATSGDDYTVTTGRLTWADGDAGDRQIEVPIATDTNAELPEFFEVVLESPEGGAGLGAIGADVEIAGASYPAGDLTIQASSFSVLEGGQAQFYVSRNYYAQGAVTVTVRVASTATATPGQDFGGSSSTDWQDLVLTWQDGESGAKFLNVPTKRDETEEQAELLTLELTAPTGGASLGDKTQATVTVYNVAPPSNPSGGGGGGGGGSFGWLGALLLSLLGAGRRR
jgi:uncharacterized delta-60 repeat protein